MLVDLTMTTWSAAKHDKKASRDVADANNAHVDSGRYNKRLIAKDALAAIKKVRSDASSDHLFLTLPWLNSGARLLTSATYFHYRKVMAEHERNFQAAVAAFLPEYPRLKAEAQASLGGLFNESDYPSEREVKSRFTFGYNVFPLPATFDPRLDLSDVEITRITRQLETNIQGALEGAVRDQYGRIIQVVGHMANRLREYTVTADGVEHPFRDSLVENVRELAALLPALNVTGDQGLGQVASRMQAELCAHDADTLRASQDARERTADAADRILAAATEFMA